MEERQYESIIIFGLGGVGSWIANFIERQRLTEELILIDFDHVEEKNIERQCYDVYDVNKHKAEMLQQTLEGLRGRLNTETNIFHYTNKITEDIDLIGFNKESLAIIATDNTKSKRIIANHFKEFILINCDKDLVEIKNHLDNDEGNAWDLGGAGGYLSEQDITSNIEAAIKTIEILIHEMHKTASFSIKLKPITQLKNEILSIEEKHND